MGRKRSALIIIALCLALGHRPAAAQSDTPPVPFPIIVIDFQEALRRSDAAEQARRQVDVLRQGYQEAFVAIEEELRAAESELADNRTRLPPEAFAERRREFEERVTQAQREAQTTRASLDQAVERAMGAVRAQLIEVIADIAQERGATLVLNKAQVILVDRSLDLTDEAVSRLDQVMPTVDVELVPE